MDGYSQYRFDPTRLRTPCYVVDVGLLRGNLQILADVKAQTGCKILLALKCFAMHRLFPLLAETLDGVCASSPHEARLGFEEFGKEVHTFGAAYSQADMEDICRTSDHILFNSCAQLERFVPMIMAHAAGSGKKIELGIRINPEHSEGAVAMYDPCAPGSRLGIRREQLQEELLAQVRGLHWHNLCEQDADCLERTVRAVEERFGDLIPRMRYVNFGGGHHITRPGYDLARLVRVINSFKERWGVQVYLEPGEAVALNCGYLVSTVLDLTKADMAIAIMDSSVPAHMPDVLEMPYRPHIIDSGGEGEKKYSYRIGGLSCLAGDVAGSYSFDRPLAVGDRLVFSDMAIYTMVKNNTFNGVGLPSIYLYEPEEDRYECVRSFGYEDFKNRLS
ncbi:carboxynorspermidine decarboxylase [Desulfopila sp. IMCC35006]|uniref:carboxynorspermidine decarboxylase n=1 Tax=Desulfopila sp. IMCC35006 TaxID=2569542 RepID=UPI0010ACEF53|nr:carboxynorspermidine decarboxylase [Desulfopila sp. IMCC35006]TKB24768.1 carboxynorspermidine decarboxylase [Desulfopila sp. IMCC35006]